MNPENIPNTDNPPLQDRGEVVKAPRVHRIWAWIFPAIAAAAGIWLLWSNWKSKGPEIEIFFEEAPGIQAGKTVLIYRGVTSGQVTAVRLDKNLDGVVVSVRLKAFASQLASEGTDFWIDQPVLSLRETTGLDSIIQGNSIQARLHGTEHPSLRFHGLSQAPLTPLDTPSLVVKLSSSDIPFLARDTPVYYKGVPVGLVRDKGLDPSGKPFLQIIVDQKYAGCVLSTSRFWILPATSFKIGQGGARLDMAGLAALIQGGIAFDQFQPGGTPVKTGTEFPLASGESAARANGTPFEISFADGHGITAGETRICLLGQPVGLVEQVRIDPKTPAIVATGRLESGYMNLLNSGSVFTAVHPQISLNGVKGLDTLATGPYIDWKPGTGTQAVCFEGRSGDGGEDSGKEGLKVVLRADRIPDISVGAPVYCRGLVAGKVLSKQSGSDGNPEILVLVERDFCPLLRENSRFWHIPATSVTAGPGVLNVDIRSISSWIQGALAFDTFEAPGAPAAGGTPFHLFGNENLAKAVSPPILITFQNGQGLLAGKTQLRHLGVPVGIVEEVRTVKDRVEVVAHLDSGHDSLRRRGSLFAIVQPQISLQGVTGIETMISGVYIDCIPGQGPDLASSFSGKSTGQPELLDKKGFEIRLVSTATGVRKGAPVTYKELSVGEIVGKSLSDDGTAVILTASIEPKYSRLVCKNSKFWDSSGVEVAIGFIKLKIHSQTILSPDGRISFANPPEEGPPAREGTLFQLGNKKFR